MEALKARLHETAGAAAALHDERNELIAEIKQREDRRTARRLLNSLSEADKDALRAALDEGAA